MIDLNNVAVLRDTYSDDEFDPVRFALLCEVAGAHGISLSFGTRSSGITERDVRLIKDLHKSYLNVHVSPKEDYPKIALSVNPDMVTFVETQKAGSREKIVPLTSEGLYMMQGFLSDLHAGNISTAALIYPEIDTLKQISKMDVDYVEFDCSQLANAGDTNEELIELDKLRSAMLGAAKLGLGINCYGGISYRHLPPLSAVPQLEDITMGLSIIKRSLEVGIAEAVKEALQQILAYQRD